MANQEAFDRTLQRIADNPGEFEMDHWYRQTACGTVACLGGHAVLAHGGEMILAGVFPGLGFATNCELDGKVRVIEFAAAELLGLNAAQWPLMFSGRPVTEAEELAGHAPRTPEELSLRWKTLTEQWDREGNE